MLGPKESFRTTRGGGDTVAKQTVVNVVDDLDGSGGAHPYTFGWEGKTYEIDLVDPNAQKLEEALQPFIDVSRPVGGRASTRTRQAPVRASRQDNAAIRAWAKERGHQVSDRGRISRTVVDAYHAEQG
jgi:hypothetical protein